MRRKELIKMKIFRTTAYALAFVVMFSCGEAQKSGESVDEGPDMEEISEDLDVVDSKRALLVESIIRSSPTIAESGEIFAEMGSDFDRHILNDIENVSLYVTLKDQGINLGIYLADLGYITSFEQSQEIIFYMNCAKKLAESIGVSDVFNEETVERMEMNINDKDSIIALISELYWKTDAFLKELGRENISAMIICGGWVEGMNIGAQMLEQGEDTDVLYQKMMAQRTNLVKILNLLNTFEGDDNITYYREKLGEIDKHFANIEKKDSEELSDDQKAELDIIAQKVTELRNEMAMV